MSNYPINTVITSYFITGINQVLFIVSYSKSMSHGKVICDIMLDVGTDNYYLPVCFLTTLLGMVASVTFVHQAITFQNKFIEHNKQNIPWYTIQV